MKKSQQPNINQKYCRIRQLNSFHYFNICKRTDHLFAILLPIQWVAAIICSIFISPKLWAHDQSMLHHSFHAALFIGGLITLGPLTCLVIKPGATFNRYFVASCQMLMSGLLIHLTAGRIETHFHIFGSLAFLAFYRDWRVLIPATVVTTIDHYVRGMYSPCSIYGAALGAEWRWLEHAGWVIFTDIFLALACHRSRKEMLKMTAREVNLEISEEKHRTVIEQMTDGLFLVEPTELRIIECNPSFAKMLGYERPSDVIGSTLFDFDFAAPPEVLALSETVRDSCAAICQERKFRHQNTELIDVEICARYITFNDSPVFCVNIKDISARKKTETEVQRLALVAKNIPNAVVITNREGQIEWVNESFTQIFNASIAEAMNHSLIKILFDTNNQSHILHEFRDAIQRGKGVEGEIQIASTDELTKWVSMSLTPIITNKEKITGFIVVAQNITALKLIESSLRDSQEHYRALTQAAPDIIITINSKQEIVFINRACENILGYEPSELIGKSVIQLFPNDTGEDEVKGIFDAQQIAAKISKPHEQELLLLHKEGYRIPAELSLSQFSLNGETYFSGLLRNIYERKQMIARLHEREHHSAFRADIGAILSTPQLSLAEILQKATLAVVQKLQATYAQIWTIAPGCDLLELRASAGINSDFIEKNKILPIGKHLIGQVAAERFPKWTNNVTAKDGIGCIKDQNIIGFAGVPLMVENRLVGVLAMFSDNPIGEETFDTLGVVSELIGQRIERQRAEHALVQAHAELEARVIERTAELKEAQEFLDSVVNNIPNPIFVKNWNGIYTMVNRAFAELHGIKAENLLGKTDYDIATSEDAQRFIRDDRQVMESMQQKIIFEEKYTDYRGELHWLQTIKRPLDIRRDHQKLLLGISTDLTERKKLESQLSHAQKMESIGQLAAGIAHEINTPTQYVGDNTRFVKDSFRDLQGVMNKFNELISSAQIGKVSEHQISEIKNELAAADVDYLLEEIPNALQQSLDGVSRIAKIVQSMKDFAHPGASEKKLADINKAIESTITVARNEWKYVADLETNYDESLPKVPCYLGEFNQVILNMIINATHAIADVVGEGVNGKGKIKITTANIADEWAEIRISDTGTGIPPHARAKIFDPFFTTKEVGKGTGQGLAISHGVIIDKHKGQLSFETEMGVGTTFIIRLPLELINTPDAN